jgi:hypothetical protein
MILLNNITIAVEKEGNIYRAYAYNKDEESVAFAKSYDPAIALTELSEKLLGTEIGTLTRLQIKEND